MANRGAMPEVAAKRTLVKSPPELWEELSEADRLAAHLAEFGEIRITRLEPEQKVSWEGECASGTVEIEPSGWGTRVTLTAELVHTSGGLEPEPEPGPEPEPEPEPATEAAAEPAPQPPPKRGFWARLLGRRPEPEPEPAREAESAPEAEAAAEPARAAEPEREREHPEPAAAKLGPEQPGLGPDRAQAVLDGALDALGAAHHRPFSRS